jgi:hypothetical protein
MGIDGSIGGWSPFSKPDEDASQDAEDRCRRTGRDCLRTGIGNASARQRV